uniref:uncharacterized protein LOC128929376 n=1 Tax=Callithrix jacchus TaxID=9483 RepID=UPI0023DD2CE8|nr:uncharacterized protein LOC128929376 [Callithrix jacchus]
MKIWGILSKISRLCLVESPAIFPPGFLPPPSPQASCCPEKSPPSLLCSAQQQQAANHRSRKARQASAYPEPTRNPLSHLSSLPRDGQLILSSYDTPPALCPRPVHPPYKTLLPQLRSRSQPRSPSFPGLPAGPNKPELGFQLSSCYLGSGTGQGSTRGLHIWCRNPGRRVASPPSDPLPPATSPALLQFGLSTPDQFIQRRFQELTRVTIHQMLLQPRPERVQETDLSLNIQAS